MYDVYDVLYYFNITAHFSHERNSLNDDRDNASDKYDFTPLYEIKMAKLLTRDAVTPEIMSIDRQYREYLIFYLI